MAIDVYLETGKKRVFAGALDWPGWCRVGHDESSALQALLDYGPRYARVMAAVEVEYEAPASLAELIVTELLEGNATTDFGAPDAVPSGDALPVNDKDLRRFQAVLRGCYDALDAAARAAWGKDLRKGPRGGGREVDEILWHVINADAGYLARIGGKMQNLEGQDPRDALALARQAVLEGLESAVRNGVPPGPRGGKRWLPRYFVRRAAWHILDHAWEIEDRVE